MTPGGRGLWPPGRWPDQPPGREETASDRVWFARLRRRQPPRSNHDPAAPGRREGRAVL